MSTRTPQRPIADVAPTPGVPRRTALIIMAVFVVLAVAATTLGSDLLRRAAATTDGDFAGETLEILIPLAEGGGTDTWARYVGDELRHVVPGEPGFAPVNEPGGEGIADRKSTRLNSSHANISYAVFCLKKKTTSHTLW